MAVEIPDQDPVLIITRTIEMQPYEPEPEEDEPDAFMWGG